MPCRRKVMHMRKHASDTRLCGKDHRRRLGRQHYHAHSSLCTIPVFHFVVTDLDNCNSWLRTGSVCIHGLHEQTEPLNACRPPATWASPHRVCVCVCGQRMLSFKRSSFHTLLREHLGPRAPCTGPCTGPRPGPSPGHQAHPGQRTPRRYDGSNPGPAPGTCRPCTECREPAGRAGLPQSGPGCVTGPGNECIAGTQY